MVSDERFLSRKMDMVDFEIEKWLKSRKKHSRARISKEELAVYKECFSIIDSDGSGAGTRSCDY